MEPLNRRDMIKQMAANAIGSLIAPGVAMALIDQAEFTDSKIVIPKGTVYETTFNGSGMQIFMKNKHFKAEIDGQVWYPSPVADHGFGARQEQYLKVEGLPYGVHTVKITPRETIVLNYKGEWVE